MKSLDLLIVFMLQIFGNDAKMSVQLTFPDKILKWSGLLVINSLLFKSFIHKKHVFVHLAVRPCRCLQSDLPGKPWTLNNCWHQTLLTWSSRSFTQLLGSPDCWLMVECGKNSLLTLSIHYALILNLKLRFERYCDLILWFSSKMSIIWIIVYFNKEKGLRQRLTMYCNVKCQNIS